MKDPLVVSQSLVDTHRIPTDIPDKVSDPDIPSWALTYAWSPFAVVVIAVFAFATIFVCRFRHPKDRSTSSTLVSILGVAVALLLAALAPVDIFLVSFMKNENGTFKDWASTNTTRELVQSAVSYAYVSLFITLLLLLFLFLPFVYFFYEEKDDGVSVGKRCCTAFKYSSVFLVLAAVLLVTGAFLPMRKPPANATDWEEKLEFLVGELGQNRGEDVLAFCINAVTILGMLSSVIYTAYGLSAMPIGLIKGRKDAWTELDDVRSKRETIAKAGRTIRDKYFDGRNMSERDKRRLMELEGQDALLKTRERELVTLATSFCAKCAKCFRPFRVVVGIVCLMISMVIFASLLIGNIDKALHSLGPKMGYALPKRTLPNPMDIVLQYAQEVFPLDYIVILLVVLFLFLASTSGIRELGVWCLCIRAYKVRPGKSRPQALVFLSFLLIFVVLGINILIYFMAPMYTLYGNQHYIERKSNETNSNPFDDSMEHFLDTSNMSTTLPETTTSLTTSLPLTTSTPVIVKRCDAEAPSDACMLTRIGLFLSRYFFKTWFFGACYYWIVWVFCGTCAIGFLVSLFKPRGSALEGGTDAEDFEESDADDDVQLLVNQDDDNLLRA